MERPIHPIDIAIANTRKMVSSLFIMPITSNSSGRYGIKTKEINPMADSNTANTVNTFFITNITNTPLQ